MRALPLLPLLHIGDFQEFAVSENIMRYGSRVWLMTNGQTQNSFDFFVLHKSSLPIEHSSNVFLTDLTIILSSLKHVSFDFIRTQSYVALRLTFRC